jgi:hypothetical protein
VILVELMFGKMVVAVVLLLPFLLMMVGVGAAVLLWFVASAALLGALVFWLVLPGTARRLAACIGHQDAPFRQTVAAPCSLRGARLPTCNLEAYRDRTDAAHDLALGRRRQWNDLAHHPPADRFELTRGAALGQG